MEAAVRRLIQTLGSSNCLPEYPDPTKDQVILDIRVDGVRCVMLHLKHDAPPLQVGLSPREIEIAQMVAKGYPNKTIAAVLDISSWTVCTYLRRLFAKLGVASRAAMVAKLHEHGFLGPPLGLSRTGRQ